LKKQTHKERNSVYKKLGKEEKWEGKGEKRSKFTYAVMLLACIWESLSSNLDQYTN
jgi:hypothetical protein